MPSSKHLLAGLVLISAVAGLRPAAAADLAPYGNQNIQEQQVEFGTGWYIRGDLAYAREPLPQITPALIVPSESSILNEMSAGLGMGYKFNNWLRADLVLDYRRPLAASGPSATQACPTQLNATGTCGSYYVSSIRPWDGLANFYFDLGTWYGLTPYVGAGVGMAWAQMTNSVAGTTSANQSFQLSTSNMSYQFAWAAMAGVSYQIMPHVVMDVGYRYLSLGTFHSISSVTGGPQSQRINANEFRVGLRYMID